MRAAELHIRPTYKLMKQNDVVSFYHMQMPRWLFFDSKYKGLSLEAKVAYTFLLNRFQLSKMNGWVNGEDEVFIIYPREKMAAEMRISYKKSIECFKELLSANLIWEHRVGRGHPNQIYLAAVVLSDQEASTYEAAPFESRSAESAHSDSSSNVGRNAPSATFQPPHTPTEHSHKRCEKSTSKHAISAHSEMPLSHTNKKNISDKDNSNIEIVSQLSESQDEQNADELFELQQILEHCELEVLGEDAAVFQNIVTRLFYSDSIRIDGASLPQFVIRSHLKHLDGLILLDTREKLRLNTKPVRNSTKYLMITLMNNIWESRSDLLVDPYLNST